MVLSKGRKLILIAAAVVIALAAALLGYNAYRNAQDRLDSAISPLLGGYAYSFADPLTRRRGTSLFPIIGTR